MTGAPILKIVTVNGKFQIQDAKGSVYGTHDTKQAAEASMEDWRRYYDDCQDTEEDENQS